MERSVLIACELGPQLRAVVDAGIAFADTLGAKPILVHVDQHPPLFLESLHAVEPGDLARMKAAYREDANNELWKTVRGLGREARGIEVTVLEGRPDALVVDAAIARQVEAIVVGAEVHGVLDHLLVGRTAHRVIRHAPCPVLTVNASGPWEGLGRILYAADLADGPPPPAEAWAVKLAGLRGARLAIVHVSQLGSDFAAPYVFPPRALDRLRESLSQRLEAVRERMAAAATAYGRGAEAVSSHLLFAEDTARTLVRAAEQERANLIVVGTHGRGGLARALLGSVAEGVLRHAKTSVLSVRQAEG